MTPKAWHPFLAAAMLIVGQTGWSQRTSYWRVYRMADGLPESACVAVTASPQGKILARHLTTAYVSQLDGYGVNGLPCLEAAPSRVYESPGGQLWTATPQGLQEYKDGTWTLHPIPEFSPAFRAGIDPVPLCPMKQGVVICLLPDRVMEFNFEDPAHPRSQILRAVAQTQLERFFGMTHPANRESGLWISGARGLAHIPGPLRSLKPQTEWHEYLSPDSLRIQNINSPREDAAGGVTALAESATNHEKLIVRFNGKDWSTKPGGAERLRDAWLGPASNLWATTIDTLLQIPEGASAIENEEVSARQYFDVASEPNGSFWLATSDGLFRYASPAWQTPRAIQTLNSPVPCLACDAQDRLWLIAGGRLHRLGEDSTPEEFSLPRTLGRALQNEPSLHPLKDGSLLLAASGRLFRFETKAREFTSLFSGNKPRNLHVLGQLRDGRLLVQSLEEDASGQSSALEICDGTEFEPFPDPPPDLNFGPRLTAFFTAQSGDLWLGGERGTACFHEKKWRTFVSADKSTPEAVVSFLELAEGKIWCATADKIWEFDGRNWSAVRRGFDRINAMLRAHDGSIWVASNNGLHRFLQGAWVENGPEEGLPSQSIRSVCADQHGRFWAGTTRGLSLFHPDADPDPPQTRIYEASDKERKIREGGTVTVNFFGQDKWKYCPRDRLLFSYKLDGGEWSAFQELTTASFTDLPAGKHYFQVRAMDRNCNIDPKPAQLEFAIIAPWYKEKRLVLISLAGLGVAIFFAGLAFNRHRQLLLSYAEVERKVTQRTRELEIANNELVHSQKMNALGTLAAGIAHDFNNILSIIKGSAQIIEDNLENPQKVCTRVDRIKTAVEQGAGIVKAMLGFSRGSDQQTGPSDLNSVVTDTLKLLGDRFLRETQVTFEPAAALPEVSVSRDLIQQILLNFLFNAAEAMAKRKQVILSTKLMEKLPRELALVPVKAAAYVSVSVQDFGCGIPPENLPRIFEPFFTTKALSARRGTGLGLSMVYELAKKIQAGLAVESIAGQGSTFVLILPVQELNTLVLTPPATRAPVSAPHE
jgi:signal transduction histidine kinase/ligand-binding sensor domain-containing protein